ncbi:MAG: ABC transporter permease [Bacteroidales bacterium]|jgi:ABC-type antimicrobial peptide transport system permease subunit|nr:ABC transporter permease [Bacteroidales bacterium]
MIKHYLKVAFRNMWKYRNQTLVSVVGLTVGFVCFAMAMLWIRYEMTYDSFHKNADRMYCINVPDEDSPDRVSMVTPNALANHLKETFPEINRVTTILQANQSMAVEFDKVEYPVNFLSVDSSFLSMFDVKIIEGNRNFLILNSKEIAITQEKARQMFGNESPLGKTVKVPLLRGQYTICATISGFSKHSNYTFDFLLNQSMRYFGYTVIELNKRIDIGAFKKKLYEHTFRNDEKTAVEKMSITPFTSLRYENPYIQREVKFQHIIIFAVASLLLILCTLFNCLNLFVSRVKIRRKEFALRTVYGASKKSLFALLSVEYALSLIIVLPLGMLALNAVFPSFKVLSEVKMELSGIYFEYLIYTVAIIFISLMILLPVFRHRTFNTSIYRSKQKLFRKISVVVQLIISIGFIFCTLIVVKQMYHLHITDLGFEYKNRGAIFWGNHGVDVFASQMKQIPEITETLIASTPLLPVELEMEKISDWDGKPLSAKEIDMEKISISEQYASFYEFTLLKGKMLTVNDDRKYVLINESAAKVLDWYEPVGKSFGNYTVKGVIKDVRNVSPTVPVQPFFYTYSNNKEDGVILFKYSEGTWKTCKDKIEQLLKKQYPEVSSSAISSIIFNTEAEYDKFLKSENTLLKILAFISLICVIIGVFGFVSIVSLTCEERRREIAIRKVNGATVKDILDIFFKEYLSLLAVGALIAFPAGYIIMKPWLEHYVIQTEISAWIYVAILLALILIIIMCVGGRVYKTSRGNPVNSINN